MKKAQKLMDQCRSRALHCSITYQSITSYSVEIYTGYKSRYKNIFYTDGHTNPKKAIKKALNFLKNNT